MLKSNLIQAVVVARDSRGVIRVANFGDELPGLPIKLEGTLAPAKEILAHLEGELNTSKLSIKNFLEPLLTKNDGSKFLCYLIELNDDDFSIPENWYTIADMLRSFAQGKNRVTYNKVMQYLAGMANPNFKIIESDEELDRKISEKYNK